MPGVYAYVRPYPGRLGAQVREMVEAEGFELGSGLEIAAGTPDATAARLIVRAKMDLLVIPFHLHRGEDREILDGVGVLLSLPDHVDLSDRAVFMPVRAFSWGSSFQRRFESLRHDRPDLAKKVIVAHQDEVGGATVSARLRRAAGQSASNRPPAGWSILPNSVTAHPPSTGRISSPAESGPISGSGPVSSGVPSSGVWAHASRAPSSAPSSLVLPRLPEDLQAGPESARESFRRAAEIGQKARRDLSDSGRPVRVRVDPSNRPLADASGMASPRPRASESSKKK